MRAVGRIRRRLLRVPLLYKIVMANAAIVVVCSLAAAQLAIASYGGGIVGLEPLLAIGLAGAAFTVLVNAALVRLALHPLRLLRETADRIRAGEWDAGAPDSALADEDMERLRQAINDMLDRLHGYRARLSAVTGQALGAAEDERRRLSRELHDDTLQRLTGLLFLVRRARSAEDPARKNLLLDQARDELADTAECLRRLAQGLRPPVLDELGLRPAVEAHVRSLATRNGMRYELTIRGNGRLHPEAEVAVYRIIQEALANARRHSRARRVSVDLELDGGRAVAVIEDDGVGFDPVAVIADPRTGRGLGLVGMRERAERAGGRLEVTTAPGQGTRLTVLVEKSEKGNVVEEASPAGAADPLVV